MIADRSSHSGPDRRPKEGRRSRARRAARRAAILLLATGLAPIPVRADPDASGIRIAIARFAGEGESAAISNALSMRLAQLGVERRLAPGSLEIERKFDPRADAVRSWASKASVDNVVVGRVERTSDHSEARQIEAAVRSGHSGAELFRHAVHVPARAALEPALDRLASAIVRDLGGDRRGLAAAGVEFDSTPPVSANADAAHRGATTVPDRSGETPARAPQAMAQAKAPTGGEAKGDASERRASGDSAKSGGLDPRLALGDFDSDAPIEIKADAAEIVAAGEGRRLVFTGSVWVHQDDLTLRSDFLEAEYFEGESEPRQLVARGAVRVEQGNRSARCDLARYERASQQITCRGHAELVQGCDIVRGELIVLDLAANKARVEGAASIVISPKQGADAQCRGAASRP